MMFPHNPRFPIGFPLVAASIGALIGNAAEPLAPPTPSAMEHAAEYNSSQRGQTMIVLYDGKCVFEQYDNGGSGDRLQMLASGSKSFVGIAAAAAVEDGLLKLDDPVSGSLTEWDDDRKKKRITYRQLLTLTSGLKASEAGFAKVQPSWEALAGAEMTGEPGEQFNYGANQLNVFAYALERLLAKETFEEYLERRILSPLGISVEWRVRCSDGHPQVGGGAFMTSRDWASYGEFIRMAGKRGDKQIVDGKLIADCFVGTESNPAYGQTWWLKQTVPRATLAKISILASEWGAAANSDWLPDDLVAALGAGKQRLYVIPSRKLVVVRQASLPNREFSDVEFLSLLLRDQSTTDQ